MNYRIRYSNELYHHGIMGMKWGVRRYQNEDGSLTSAGKSRYGSEGSSLRQKIHNFRVERARKYGTKMANRTHNYAESEKERARTHKNAYDDLKKHGRHSETYEKWNKDIYQKDVNKRRSEILKAEEAERIKNGQDNESYDRSASWTNADRAARAEAGMQYMARTNAYVASIHIDRLKTEHKTEYSHATKKAKDWERANKEIMDLQFDPENFKDYKRKVKTAYRTASERSRYDND